MTSPKFKHNHLHHCYQWSKYPGLPHYFFDRQHILRVHLRSVKVDGTVPLTRDWVWLTSHSANVIISFFILKSYTQHVWIDFSPDFHHSMTPVHSKAVNCESEYFTPYTHIHTGYVESSPGLCCSMHGLLCGLSFMWGFYGLFTIKQLHCYRWYQLEMFIFCHSYHFVSQL